MPDPDSSSAAALAASEVPMTRWPPACQAARAASRAKVLPVPARPSTSSTPEPEVVREVNHVHLLIGQVGAIGQGVVQHLGARHAPAGMALGAGRLDQSSLKRHQLGRGVAGFPAWTRGDGHYLLSGHEGIGEGLELGQVRPVGGGLGPGPHHVAPLEGRRVGGEPVGP